MIIQYNTPIEVTKKKYTKLMSEFSGVVAGREEDGKYYIKVLIMKYAKYVEQIINKKEWF